MKKQLFAFLMALCMCAALIPAGHAGAVVASGYCGADGDGKNLSWTLTADGTLTISGTGNMKNWSTTNAPWYPYHERITSAVISDGVTSIGNHAFFRYTTLKNIRIPDSVTRIGIWALCECRFDSLFLPRSVVNIDVDAFYSIKTLNSFSVDSENPAYVAVDGVIFTKDMKKLVAYPTGRKGACQIPDSVTKIVDGAFGNCRDLSNISIPDSVTTIGDYAFDWCTGLNNIQIPESVTHIGSYTFSGVEMMSVSIPANVTRIGAGTFRYCSRLTDIYIPAGVSSIASSAFEACAALKDIWYGGTEAQWKQIQYVNSEPLASAVKHWNALPGVKNGSCGDNLSWTLADGVLTISGAGNMWNWADDSPAPWYNYRDDITSVVISGGVTSIGNAAFLDCRAMTAVTVPDGLTEIGDSAFSHCQKLTGIFVPDSVTKIGVWSFNGCEALTSFYIPGNVSYVGPAAFYGCKSMGSLFVDSGNADYVSIDGVLFSKDRRTLIAYPGGRQGGYHIPSGVTVIKSDAFGPCAGLNAVSLPEGLTKIEEAAFEGCVNLTAVRIPDSVTSIENFAFNGCSGLEGVTIPRGVTAIGWGAFGGCEKLTGIGVDSDNSAYVSVDGVVFTKDMKTLVMYPPGKTGEYRIPGSVTKIQNSAFHACAGPPSVRIPASMTDIGQWAFRYCYGLTSIYISESVSSIGPGAFQYCAGLKDVWYVGTAEQWEAVSIDGDNEPLTSAAMHWNAGLLKLSFDANGGSGSMSPRKVADDGQFTLPVCGFTAPSAAMKFDGWLVNGTVYQPGQTVQLNADAVAVAQWFGLTIGGVTLNQDTVTVTFSNEVRKPVSVVVCAYSDAGKMLSCAARTIDTGATADLNPDTSGAAYLKAFLLSPDTSAPLCVPFRKDF